MNRPKEQKTIYMREYRAKHRKKLRAYNRKYNSAWRKKHGYHNEEASKKRHPRKERARRKLQYAVRVGKIVKEPCKCGKKAEAHHPNYNFPLRVVWVCRQHHSELHRKVIHN